MKAIFKLAEFNQAVKHESPQLNALDRASPAITIKLHDQFLNWILKGAKS